MPSRSNANRDASLLCLTLGRTIFEQSSTSVLSEQVGLLGCVVGLRVLTSSA